jgi:predicted nuclease of predicted toxin-antitoxin system
VHSLFNAIPGQQNFSVQSIAALRAAHHDVAAITEDTRGITDAAVLARAVREDRLILTFERDYGELVFARRQEPPVGIFFFRFRPLTAEEPARRLLALLALPNVRFAGQFTVVERDDMRQRPLF